MAPKPDSPLHPAPPWRSAAVAIPAAAALAYALGHLGWYLGTPLGRVPVLDERENLDLAEAIATGTLPWAPFYRAPGYALVLAGLRACGLPAGALFPAALVLGAALHAVSAALVARVAGHCFGARAALAGGLLFALDPVMVHYATQALDAGLGLALFLGGLAFLVAAADAPARAAPWAGAGVLWAAAALVRPNYLAAWALVPVLALFAPGAGRAARVGAALAGVLLFGAQSAWQWRVSGATGFLPWQGAYNLWAANRPGSNGRYYSQQVSVSPALARANPARAESVYLYVQETGGRPDDIGAMNAHWRRRFLAEVAGHPLRWALLEARKAYALLNDWEQYNNKTFAFHKARSPWLAWNPIGWGVLLVLGVAGAARLRAESPRAACALGAAALACAAGVLLFYAGARFRLPLAALLCVAAGGALGSPGFWRAWPAGRRAALAAAMAAAALAAFSNLGGVRDASTFVQDHALLARASLAVGDYRGAIAEADAALRMQPWHPDAAAVRSAAAAALANRAPP